MPVAPLAVALVAPGARARDGAGRRGRRGQPSRRLALALVLAAWSALFAVALWRDPQAANDSALLLAKSTYADGNQYVPNLFIRHWSDGGARACGRGSRPGSLAAVLLAARPAPRALAGAGARGRAGRAARRSASLLERWPSTRTAPVHADALAAPARRRRRRSSSSRAPCACARTRRSSGPARWSCSCAAPAPAARRPAAPCARSSAARACCASRACRRSRCARPAALWICRLITYHVVGGGDGPSRGVLAPARDRLRPGRPALRRRRRDLPGDPPAAPTTDPAAAGEPDQE